MGDNEATIWLTAALVLVTTYYAIQNQRMVRELREARKLSITPKLAISIFMAGPTFGVPRMTNVGQGPALNVDVVISFPRRDGGPLEERTWQAPVMPPGEAHDFLPPGDPQQINTMEDFARIYSEIQVKGAIKSSLGDGIKVDESTGDLLDWYEMSAAVRHVWEEEPRRKVPKELERIRKALEVLRRHLRQ